MGPSDILRRIPKTEKILALLSQDPTLNQLSSARLLEAVRLVLANLRENIIGQKTNTVPLIEDILAESRRTALDLMNLKLKPVINATGIILHTNLGRAPLALKAAEEVQKAALFYSTLEYDPIKGIRNDRLIPVEELLIGLTGAEAAMAVNNNAAALFLLMVTLAQGRKVVISRGELVEIGGAFRLSDIIEAGGATIAEVGSTNRTRLADYQKALGSENAAAILKVHASNFKKTGYTGETGVEELAPLARSYGLPLIVDAGSGTFLDLAPLGLSEETPVQKILTLGADAVCFSGDKLLGAAQAGLIAGKKDIICALKKHPLARTVRPDKLTLAALEATLKLAQDPAEAKKQIPTWRMLYSTEKELQKAAVKLKRTLGTYPGLNLAVIRTESRTGGGSAPEQPLNSWAVAIESPNLEISRLEERLRQQNPPLVARIWRDRLILDVRTVFPAQYAQIKNILSLAWTELTSSPASSAEG
ncbi:MAG: L-seryl-tRNA(Sec) selenium transferase [Deltaproteobacteria bacterium]|jgi:L-seryl-tRNA(Ser) seleniumtransferase|nr:L-seryl-tRNA(Sec) selenium transferase [Deltaproteobacteria bacterium]